MSKQAQTVAKPDHPHKPAPRRPRPSRIIAAVDKERERIGQELHDDICQILTGVSCLVQVSASRIENTLPAESARLREINRRVIEAMNRARAICHGLHPEHALGETIRDMLSELARQSTERFATKIKQQFPPKNTPVPAHTREQLMSIFRIAQEAICNAVRHGRATQIAIRLHVQRNGLLRLEVEDNGSGLPTRKPAPKGIGVRTMNHRAAQLGGRITLTPSPRLRKGTLLTLIYPSHAR